MPDPPTVPASVSTRSATPGSPDRRIERYLLRQHTTACAVVDVDYDIQHLYGPTERYLVPPTGESRQNLLAWIRPGFYIQLRSALRQAIDSGERIYTDGEIERDGVVQRVQGCIEPIPTAVGADGFYLVTFRDVGDAAQRKVDLANGDERVVRELEQDLVDTRRELQTTVEQLESAGEEHRASHEELLSLNEELQSSNEELEASKEELEALNEEMNTINRELEQKNSELREANADLQNLFTSTGIPTVFLNRDLNIRRYTSAATEVMRLVASDIGRSIEHVKERFSDGSTMERCRDVLDRQRPDISAVRLTDGRYFMRSISPYCTEDDRVDGICITFVDVTEETRATQQSELAREYAEAIVRTARTPLLVLDANLNVESMNDAFRLAFGANDTFLGRPLPGGADPDWHLPTLDDVLALLMATGDDIVDHEVTIHDRNIAINARQVEFDGKTAGVVLSFEDITSHMEREAHRHAEQRAVELKEEADRKDQWIAMLGHELRNPVGAVVNGIRLLQSGKVSVSRQPHVIEMMDRQTGHVSRLLDELLDAARIIAGKLDIEQQPVDLAEIGQWAVDSVYPLMDDNRHDLTVNLPRAGTIWVKGDAVRLTEVIGNLLTNAAKYTDPGGAIGLEVTADEKSAVIRVRDSGIGIPGELTTGIFEIFTQGPPASGRSARGLGLGLPMVKSLVEAHHGDVQVLSEGAGKGSEFRVTLPRMAHRPTVAPRADADRTTSSPPRRILVVDDVQDASDSLAMLLQGHGHETVTVNDGSAAQEAARKFKPDIALLDLGLPGMDGYELARHLRREWPEARLIAVTGYQKDAARLEEAGFDDHLLKPVRIDRLLTLIDARTAHEEAESD